MVSDECLSPLNGALHGIQRISIVVVLLWIGLWDVRVVGVEVALGEFVPLRTPIPQFVCNFYRIKFGRTSQ